MSVEERSVRVDEPIPGWVVLVHALVVLGAFSIYCGFMYVLVRPLFGSFGFEVGCTLKSLLSVLLLGCFIFFLIPVVELPRIWFRHVRPRVRVRRGCCPSCGYAIRSEQGVMICPECGSDGTLSPAWKPDAHTLKRFLLLLIGAILLGGAVGEWSLIVDERRFEREASLQTYPNPSDNYSRARAWPNGHAWMTYTPEAGPTGSSFSGSSRIRRWQRGEEE